MFESNQGMKVFSVITTASRSLPQKGHPKTFAFFAFLPRKKFSSGYDTDTKYITDVASSR